MTYSRDILIKAVTLVWAGLIYLAVFSALVVAAYGMYLGLYAMFGIQFLAIFLSGLFGGMLTLIFVYILRILAY